MGYLQALQLMVRAYKAAKGVMPKGIDLLKMKMKARQKVIDSNKVIKFPQDKITPFYKPRPRSESEAQMLTRMNRQNKESVARLKKKKDLGDKLKDYKGDPDAMREGGIISLANGGLTNISQTYDNNPTLQAQYPNKQDYLDLFSSQTTTTTPQTNTTTQSTTSTIAPINPIKPIIKIPQSDGGDGGGGITSIDKGLTVADDYGFGPYGNNFNDPDVQDEIDALNPGGVKGFMQGLGNFYKTVSPFLNAKRALAKGQDFALDLIQKAKDAAAARELAKLQEAARAAGFQGDTRTDAETSFASSQTYGGGGSRGDMGADTFI